VRDEPRGASRGRAEGGVSMQKWMCEMCDDYCIAHGPDEPTNCPYEYAPGEFCWIPINDDELPLPDPPVGEG